MSCDVLPSYSLRRSALTASQKIKNRQQSPLKSVENVPSGTMNGLVKAESTSMGIAISTESFLDNFTVEQEVGRGKFATVKKCQRKHTGQSYAAKFLRKRRKGKNCREDILQEVKMLVLAKEHTRLVDLVEVYETNNEIIIVTEYAPGGELFHHVVMEEGFEERFVLRWMRQIISGLIFLHDRNIVHLDVKPQNILLTKDPPISDVKLCDFGFARTVNSGEDVRDIIGTPDYVAPEVLSYEPIHTASDMWSVGVLAYVMLTGCSPFAGDNKMETFSNITQVSLDFPEDLFENVSDDAVDFIKKLLVREASERLTARDCLNHTWLREDPVSSSTQLPPVTKSPFGSPIGCRRALTPSPDGFLDAEPMKRCKCAEESSSGDELLDHDCNMSSSVSPQPPHGHDDDGDVLEPGGTKHKADVVNGNLLQVPEAKLCRDSGGGGTRNNATVKLNSSYRSVEDERDTQADFKPLSDKRRKSMEHSNGC